MSSFKHIRLVTLNKNFSISDKLKVKCFPHGDFITMENRLWAIWNIGAHSDQYCCIPQICATVYVKCDIRPKLF